MRKADFLSDADVKAMMACMAERFETPCGWSHGYVERQRDGVARSFVSLGDAFRQYSWKKRSWRENKKTPCVSNPAANVVENRDAEAAFSVCVEILRWGGVSSRNAARLAARRGECPQMAPSFPLGRHEEEHTGFPRFARSRGMPPLG